MFGIGLIGRIKRKEALFCADGGASTGLAATNGSGAVHGTRRTAGGPRSLGSGGGEGRFWVGRRAGRQPRPDGLDSDWAVIGSFGLIPALRQG